MTTLTNSRLGAVLLLLFAGCVGPVEIAPLPYSHPANPGAPAGKMSEIGTSLTPTQSDIEDEPKAGASAPHQHPKPAGPHEGHAR